MDLRVEHRRQAKERGKRADKEAAVARAKVPNVGRERTHIRLQRGQ